MKHTTRFILCICTALCATAAALRAATLTADTPVYTAPDAASAVIVTLAAGTDPVPSTSAGALALPEGWQAVDVTSTQEIWVRDSDLNKELDIKPGSELRAEPKADSAVVGTMIAGAQTELRGIQGKWVQMLVSKKTTGYIAPGVSGAPAAPAPAPASTAVPAPAASAAAPSPAPASASAPVADANIDTSQSLPYAPNQRAADANQRPLSVDLQRGSVAGAPLPARQTQNATQPAAQQTGVQTAATSAARPVAQTGVRIQGGIQQVHQTASDPTVLPRAFEGTFASTRRAFAPRRPYEYQLTGPDGTRHAYLDLGKILVTEPFENFIGRTVAVYGVIAAVPGTSDIVIKAETLQLK